MIKIFSFSTVRTHRKIAFNNKISYCVWASSIVCRFVRTLHATRPIHSFSAGNDILRQVQTQSTKQNGRPGSFCSSVKNRLWYHFAVCPTSESCSQRCSRRIMLLRSLIKTLLASYSSKCYWGKIVSHGIIGIRFPVWQTYIPERCQFNTAIPLHTGIPPTPGRTCVIFTDSKVFDTVPHQHQLKLVQICIRETFDLGLVTSMSIASKEYYLMGVTLNELKWNRVYYRALFWDLRCILPVSMISPVNYPHPIGYCKWLHNLLPNWSYALKCDFTGNSHIYVYIISRYVSFHAKTRLHA